VKRRTRSLTGRVAASGLIVLLLGGTLLSNIASATALSSEKAVITGSLRIFGGVADTPSSGTPVAGRVVFEPTRGASRVLRVGRSGEFTISVVGGTYKAFGGPPAWGNDCLVNNGKAFHVESGQHLNVVVACVAL
jgi:hypothetical protein